MNTNLNGFKETLLQEEKSAVTIEKYLRDVAVQTGLLQGFVTIRPEWKTISHARLWNASGKAMKEGLSEADEENELDADDASEMED